jgi:hypothetical protein
VGNLVAVDGASKRPAKGRIEVGFQSPKFALSFLPATVVAAPGKEFKLEVDMTSTGNKSSDGLNSWTLSVAHDPAVLEILDATHEGGILDSFNQSEIFAVTQTVANESGNGFISAVILTFGASRLTIPPEGTVPVAFARYRVLPGVRTGTASRIFFVDGLHGTGQPMANQVNFIGGTLKPERPDFYVRVARMPFVRGNVNGDDRVNLADAIFILNKLYKGGDDPNCKKSADVNDDGKVNLADAIYLLTYMYKNGDPPPLPFPGPDEDPTPDALDCEQFP